MASGGAGSPFFCGDLRRRVEHFAGGKGLRHGVLGERERSYDHCYNYFARTEHPTDDLEKSCAVLAFYLASWGMYRGSTFLFNHTNSTHFVPVISFIEEFGEPLRAIDVECYDGDANVDLLEKAYARIKEEVLPQRNTAVTLVTKILAGVFGCVPAYDTYFRTGIREITRDYSREAFWSFNRGSLRVLSDVYRANALELDALATESAIWLFADSDSPTGLPLKKVKILDMYCFDRGRWPNAVPAAGGIAQH